MPGSQAWPTLIQAIRLALGVDGEPTALPSHSPDLLQLADRHGVSPLLAASSAVGSLLTDDLRSELERRARSASVDSLAQLRQLDEVLTLLREADVFAISFKGPSLAAIAYGDAGRRPSMDIDIMVPRSAVARGVDTLVAAGYRPPLLLEGALDEQIRLGRELGFLAPERFLVEVQWAFAPPQDGTRLRPGDLMVEWTKVGGLSLPTFRPADLLVALGVHAARERWWRLLWTADVAGLVQRAQIDWDRVVQLAEDSGTARITRISLSLADRLLGLGPPGYLCRWMRADDGASAWVDRIVAAEGAEPISRIDGTLVGLHDRRRSDIVSAFRWLTVPTPDDLKALHLPRKLAPAYAVARPARLLRDALRRSGT